MIKGYVGGWNCTADTIVANHWEPDFVGETMEAFKEFLAEGYKYDEIGYDDTVWIQIDDGEVEEYWED